MKKNSLQLIQQERPGFVLLFSLVVSAIVFFIGAGIFSLSFKELLVSSISRESQKSIIAADSGVECALYADTWNAAFSDTSVSSTFRCFGQDITAVPFGGTFTFQIPLDNDTCSIVHVYIDEPAEGNKTVVAAGYNKCTGDDPNTGYAGLTERVYRVSF